MHLAPWEEISSSIIRQSYQSVVTEIQSFNKIKPPQKSWSPPLHRSYRVHHSLYFICEIPWNNFLSIFSNCACAQLYPTLSNSLDCSPWNFPGKNTGVGCHFLLQGIFPIQESDPHVLGLLHYRWILYYWDTGESPQFLNFSTETYQMPSLL